MNLEEQIADLEAQLKAKKVQKALEEKKRVLEAELRELCPDCYCNENNHGSPCTDGMG